tara:strand:- start:2012 stop:3151 length:1140 start_codon:yes stop_codon:yes gene_type:complete
MGMLVKESLERGHDVIWWGTTFNHPQKTLVSKSDDSIRLGDSGELRLLHCGSYSKNISLARYLHHFRFGYRLSRAFATEKPPDLILSAYPVIASATAAVTYSKRNSIPLVLDVRDRWPDQYLDHIPKSLKPLARLLLSLDFRNARKCFSGATCLTAMSREMLTWALNYVGRSRNELDRSFHIGYARDCSPEHRFVDRATPLFVYAGSFGRTYDIEKVLAAFAELEREGQKNWKLVLGGKGERYDDLQNRFRSDRIHFAGWLDEKNLKELFGGAHWGIVPWAGESGAFPNKVFEYLSFGLPILSSIRGELWDIVEQDRIGMNFDVSDIADIKSQISACIQQVDKIEEYRMRVVTKFNASFKSSRIYGDFCTYLETVMKEF